MYSVAQFGDIRRYKVDILPVHRTLGSAAANFLVRFTWVTFGSCRKSIFCRLDAFLDSSHGLQSLEGKAVKPCAGGLACMTRNLKKCTLQWIAKDLNDDGSWIDWLSLTLTPVNT